MGSQTCDSCRDSGDACVLLWGSVFSPTLPSPCKTCVVNQRDCSFVLYPEPIAECHEDIVASNLRNVVGQSKRAERRKAWFRRVKRGRVRDAVRVEKENFPISGMEPPSSAEPVREVVRSVIDRSLTHLQNCKECAVSGQKCKPFLNFKCYETVSCKGACAACTIANRPCSFETPLMSISTDAGEYILPSRVTREEEGGTLHSSVVVSKKRKKTSKRGGGRGSKGKSKVAGRVEGSARMTLAERLGLGRED